MKQEPSFNGIIGSGKVSGLRTQPYKQEESESKPARTVTTQHPITSTPSPRGHA